jgi:hypothetical protein
VVFDYSDIRGVAQQYEVDGTDTSWYQATENEIRHSVAFDKYGATQLRDEFTISFRNKTTGEQIGDSLVCSIESYVAQKYEESTDENFRELLILIMKYGDSAHEYAEYTEAQSKAEGQ